MDICGEDEEQGERGGLWVSHTMDHLNIILDNDRGISLTQVPVIDMCPLLKGFACTATQQIFQSTHTTYNYYNGLGCTYTTNKLTNQYQREKGRTQPHKARANKR